MGKPLLDVLRDVVLDPAEQAAFANDPSAYLAQYGYEGVAPDDLSEAFGLVADTLPPDVAQAAAVAAPAVPPSPVDDLDDGGEGGAFGDVNHDFDAVADDGGALPEVDGLDAGFGTGEVSAVDVADDAFGEGFDAEPSPEGFAVDADDHFATPSVAEAGEADTPGYDDTPDVGLDDLDDLDGVDVDDLGLGDHAGDLPDDPGDLLDDIGSF